MRARRLIRRPSDLTSMFDVLFIVVFAALIRAASVQASAETVAKPTPSPPVISTPLDPSTLHARALVDLNAQLAARPSVVVRISPAGTVTKLELDNSSIPLDVPLLEPSADPDLAVTYLGDRSSELRVCKIVALHVSATELGKYLVIIAPDVRLADLPHALYDGLHRDVDRCFAEQHGVAAIVEPATKPSP
ncbi:MAG: hypothetical protein QM831_12755 [Kofleriaceae bacterium]